MARNQLGILWGIAIAILWIWFGFGNLIFILVAGLIGYVVASLTGSTNEIENFRNQVNRLLDQRSRNH